MEERRKQDLTAEADGIIEGRNAVIEALRAGETIDKIYLQKGETDKTLGHIASKARAAGVVVVEADRRKLDAMSRTHAHQGVIALAAVREYISVESILQAARDKGEAPLLVVCDEINFLLQLQMQMCFNLINQHNSFCIVALLLDAHNQVIDDVEHCCVATG